MSSGVGVNASSHSSAKIIHDAGPSGSLLSPRDDSAPTLRSLLTALMVTLALVSPFAALAALQGTFSSHGHSEACKRAGGHWHTLTGSCSW
jgi:hypothetical protein